MQNMIVTMLLGVMLLFCSVQDFLYKRVNIWVVIIGGILTTFSILMFKTITIPDSLGGFFIGVSVILISRVTRGKIGMADGLILCVTGLGLGFWRNLELFAYALFAAAMLCIFLLVFHLADRKKSIPFIPFLLLSYVILTLVTIKAS